MISQGIEARIEALEARIAELETALERQPRVASIDRPVGDAVDDGANGRTSRRTMLKVAAGASGAAVAAALIAKPVAATDGDPVIAGGNNTSAGGNTRIFANTGGAFGGKNIFTAQDTSFSSSFPSAIGGFAAGGRVYNGVFGYSQSRTATVSTGHALIGWATSGGRSHLYMVPDGSDPRDDAYAHAMGEVRVDASGNVWSCVVAGTPGTWQKLGGPDVAGSVHAIEPKRVYDSRLSGGLLTKDSNRIVSVANGINIQTGVVDQTDVVPAGATAVMFNLTIVSTVGSGFLSISPGDAGDFGASMINWFASNQVLANGSIAKLDSSRQLRAWAGNSDTQFLIDITGYTL